MARAKQQTPLKRAGQTILAVNKRKKEFREDTPYQPPKKISRLDQDDDDDNEVGEITEEFYADEEADHANSIEEEEFWENDKLTKAQWAAEARRYKIPICTKTLCLTCPAKECLENGNVMSPAYITCKSRQGGTYVAMMFVCNYCSAFAPTKEDAQKCNVFAGHIVTKFAQNYLRKARDCGVNDISKIPLPPGTTVVTGLCNIDEMAIKLNQSSNNLPNLVDMSKKLDEIHSIIVDHFGKKVERKKEEEVFEKVELSEELLEEDEAATQADVD